MRSRSLLFGIVLFCLACLKSGLGQIQLRTLRNPSCKATVFLVHGLGQTARDMDAFRANLASILGTEYSVNDSFNFGDCAQGGIGLCGTESCTIAAGGRLLADTINWIAKKGSHVVVIGFSMGGLIARDMIINNSQSVATTHKIDELITIGTPNLGYPYGRGDLLSAPILGVCGAEMYEMASDFRTYQDLLPPRVDLKKPDTTPWDFYSDLRKLTDKWSGSKSLKGAPLLGYWSALSGGYCNQSMRWGDVTNTLGCPNYNMISDGVVCEQSSQYLSAGFVYNDPDASFNNQPDDRHGFNSYAHSSEVIMCGPNVGDSPLLYQPKLGSPLLEYLQQEITTKRSVE